MNREILAKKYATGLGLEIGALPSPWPNPNNAIIDYMDSVVKDDRIKYKEDGTLCQSIPDGTYDFILNSHVFEHLSNPLLAMKNWCRALKSHGTILMAIPEKTQTFDRDRKLTTFNHLVRDFIYPYDDSEHYDEVYPGRADVKISKPNLHFHVWDHTTLRAHIGLICEIFKLELLEFEFVVFEVQLALRKK